MNQILYVKRMIMDKTIEFDVAKTMLDKSQKLIELGLFEEAHKIIIEVQKSMITQKCARPSL